MRSTHDSRDAPTLKYRLSSRSSGLIVSSDAFVKDANEAKYGEYRTKQLILKMYGQMKEAMDSGTGYQTWLDPPPADERMALALSLAKYVK